MNEGNQALHNTLMAAKQPLGLMGADVYGPSHPKFKLGSQSFHFPKIFP